MRDRFTIFAAVPAKHKVEEFRHLASGAHDQRMRFIAFVAAVIKAATARHLEPAPFAFDSMQASDVLTDSLFFFHAGSLPHARVNRCSGKPNSSSLVVTGSFSQQTRNLFA